MIQLLFPGDEGSVDAFLSGHAATSMLLRSHLWRSGLSDAPRAFHGTWVAAVDERGITGVVMHAWTGNLILQAPAGAPELVRAALEASGRAATGFVGPWAQVSAARDALPELGAPRLDGREDLFDLDLRDLRVPAALADGRWRWRVARPADADRLAAWRYDYSIEANHRRPGQDLADDCRATIERGIADGNWFVLEDGDLVSMSAFNARSPDCVQIGGVWTPPAMRGRGYARATVAGSLLAAREAGVGRSILFTDQRNEPARRAYQSLGYRIIGDYGLVLY